MIIQCNNCQKKYKIDPRILNTNKIIFQCKRCRQKVIHYMNPKSSENTSISEEPGFRSATQDYNPASSPTGEDGRLSATLTLGSEVYPQARATAQMGSAGSSKRSLD